MSEPTRITILDNGFRIISERLPGVRTAAVGVWVDVGSRYEPAEVNGVAHLLEHMAFKGTTTRSARAIAEAIENVGGSLNAYTSREHTAYYARVLSGDVPLALDLLADILKNSTFVEEELEKERYVILQEIGQVLDTPDDLVFDLFQERAFPNQAIGRSILGPATIVERLSRDAIVDYLDRYYRPARMILSATGDIDYDALVALAAEHFGHLPNGASPDPEPARYVGSSLREEQDLEQVHLCYGIEGVPYEDPDYFAAQVLSTALGGGMSSRLFQEARENRGLCYSISTFAAAYVETGLFGIYSGTAADDVDELTNIIGTETRALVRNPDPAEIARARAQLKAGLLMSLESCFAVADDIARQLFCYGRRLPVDEIIRRIDAVDVDAIARVGRRLFASGRDTTLVSLGPLPKLPQIELGRLAV